MRGDWPLMFLWLGVALVVDGIDGPLARAVNVAEVLPRWSGETLDLVVDFTTYVFVPAYAIAASGLMPQRLGDRRGRGHRRHRHALFRRPQHEDRGQFLPRLSGGVEPGRVLSAAAAAGARRGGQSAIALFAVLTFVPVRFVHPFRVRRLRTVTVALLTLVGGAGARGGRSRGLRRRLGSRSALCALALYFLGVGLLPSQAIGATRWHHRTCFSSPAPAAASAPRPRSLRRRAATTSASTTRPMRSRRPMWSRR